MSRTFSNHWRARMVIERDGHYIEMEFSNLKIELVEPENNYTSETIEIDFDGLEVKDNGEVKDNFGEAFNGYKFHGSDVLEAVVCDYINNNTGTKFIEVPDVLKQAKAELFESCLVINDREIPKKLYRPSGNVLEIVAATDGLKEPNSEAADYHGNISYVNSMDGSFVLTDAQGDVVTDMEAFWLSGTLDMYRNEHVVYGEEYLRKLAQAYEE